MECAYSVNDRFRRNFSLTPYSFSVGVMIFEYCRLYTDKEMRPRISKLRHRAAMITILQLIHRSEKSCEGLLETCFKVFPPSVHKQTVNEFKTFQKGGVDAIFSKVSSIEKNFTGNDHADYSNIHKNSVVGMFFRKLILAINTLDFTSQVKFSAKVKAYVEDACLQKFEDTVEAANSTTPTSTSSKTIRENEMSFNTQTGESFSDEDNDLKWAGNDSLSIAHGRDKARAFLWEQGQKLKDNPVAAYPPKDLHSRLLQILSSSPDMAEAHYLSFVNNLLFGEYVSAVANCHKHFLLKRDGKGKKFRYALLNLAMIHKRFGHEKQAEIALKESIELSQQAGDKECLQQAMVWLCRTNQDEMSLSLKNSVVQSWQKHLWLLYSLGLQTLTKLGAIDGRSPSTCFEILGGKHLTHSDSPAILMNYEMSAAILWTSYGFHRNAKLHCEMVIHSCYSKITSRQYHWVIINENVILAIIFCSRYALQDYDYELAKKLLEIAMSLVPSYSELRNLIDIAVLCNECERNLHKGCFVKCKAAINSLNLLSPSDAQLYNIRMLQQLGNYEKAIKLTDSFLENTDHLGSYGRVIRYLLKARILIDMNSDNPFQCILEGLALCERYNLLYLESLFKLELVRAQSRSGYAKQLLQSTINSVTPMILSHGSKHDKLFLRSVVAEISENEKAIEEMIACYEDWTSLGDAQKSKVALEFIARKCHEIGDRKRRNRYAKLFRMLVSSNS